MLRLVLAFLVLANCIAADARILRGTGSSGLGTNWQTLHIGAGGKILSLDLACDQGVGECSNSGTVTQVIKTDTYGAYFFNKSATNCGNALTTGCWQQLVTLASMPSGFLTLGGGFGSGVNAYGVMEIVVAPSNTQIFYMLYDGFVFVTSNQGATWTKTSFTQIATVDPNQQPWNINHYLMAVDPVNPNVVYVTSITGSAYVTVNGGTTWSVVPNVGTAGSNLGHIFAFDPTSATNCGAGSNQTCGIYVSTYGTGLFHSTNGGTSFSAVSGTPTTHVSMAVGSDGDVWFVDNSSGGPGGVLHLLAGGTWTSLTGVNGSTGFGGNPPVEIAVDPANAAHAVASNGAGLLSVTNNHGTTWTGWASISGVVPANNHVATDIPWLAWTNESSPVIGQIRFDPSGSNLLHLTDGIGVWDTTPQAQPVTSSTSLTPPGSFPTTVGPFTTSVDISASLALGQSIILVDSANTSVQIYGTLTGIAGTSLTMSAIGGAGTTAATWIVVAIPTLNSRSAAIEQLVGNQVLFPPSGKAVTFWWDRAAFYSVSPTTYPSTHGPNATDVAANPIIGGWSADWCAASPSTVVALMQVNGGTDYSGISTNGGQTYTDFASKTPGAGGSNGYGTIACSSASSMVWVGGGTSSVPYYATSANGASWATATFPAGVPTTGSTGWCNGFTCGNAGQNRHQIAADRVNSNTFYAYNYSSGGAGVYISTNSGQNWTQQLSGLITGNSGTEEGAGFLKTVPGHAGNIFWCDVNVISGGASFMKSVNAGVSWSVVNSNFTFVAAYGFGATFSGQSYPSILAFGIYSGVYGLFQSIDGGNNWTNVTGSFSTGDLNNGTPIVDIDGDKSTPGSWVLILQTGAGAVYKTNWLLKRDLDPASNDNDPMWLEKVG